MADKLNHQGIAILLKSLGERRWRWEIAPPSCVLGLKEQAGEISGDQSDAVRAARSAIERQTGYGTH